MTAYSSCVLWLLTPGQLLAIQLHGVRLGRHAAAQLVDQALCMRQNIVKWASLMASAKHEHSITAVCQCIAIRKAVSKHKNVGKYAHLPAPWGCRRTP